MGWFGNFFGGDNSLTVEQVAEMAAEIARNELLQVTGESYDDLLYDIRDPDEGDWLLAGQELKSADELPGYSRDRTRKTIRRLVKFQSNAGRAIKLYQGFVFRSGWTFQVKKKEAGSKLIDSEKKVIAAVRQVWEEFLLGNRLAVTAWEICRRVYRDGECFIRRWDDSEWPPKVRFIDPEEIEDPNNPELKGIITRNGDVTDVVSYRHLDIATGTMNPDITAEDIVHLKLDVDSNVKRGESRFLSSHDWIRRSMRLLSSEFTHRQMQAAIVLQRKIKGSPGVARRQMDHNAAASNGSFRTGDRRRENFREGSIITVNESSELEFKQPTSNFEDASPLMKALILQLSAGTGWPYYMISSDAGDANLGGNQIQEGPTSVMVDDERQFFYYGLLDLFKWVCEVAIAMGRLPKSTFEDFSPDAYWPSVVVRDLHKEAQANNIEFIAGVLTRQEWCRMKNRDPDQVAEERAEDIQSGLFADPSAQNQTIGQKAENQPANQGQGKNQGKDKPIEHGDNKNVKGDK